MKKTVSKLIAFSLIMILCVGFVAANCQFDPEPVSGCASDKLNTLSQQCQNKEKGAHACSSQEQSVRTAAAGRVKQCITAAKTGNLAALDAGPQLIDAICTEVKACAQGSVSKPSFASNLHKGIGSSCGFDPGTAKKIAEGANENKGLFGDMKLGDIASLISAGAAVAQAVIAYLNYEETASQNDINNAREDRREARELEDRAKQQAGECQDASQGIGIDCPATGAGGGGTATASFGSNSNTFCTGNICQDVSQVPKGTNLIFASIHMTFPNGDFYSLLGGPNRGLRVRPGIVNFDSSGTTRFAIKSPWQPIQNSNGNILAVGRGTTYYYATSNAYVTNSKIIHPETQTVVLTTAARDGDEFSRQNFVTGAVTGFGTSDLVTAVSYNQFSLPSFSNAVDISNSGDSKNILGRGFTNLELFSSSGRFFPLFLRNVAKGDTMIVLNKGVTLDTGYVIRDGTYNYLIFPHEGSTKVAAANSKIIQDSAGVPQKMSAREQALIYSGTYAAGESRPDLVFE